MSTIAHLDKRYELNSAALAAGGVKTVEELWNCVGKDPDSGITQVVTKDAIARDVLLAFLIADSLDPARQEGFRRIGGWLTKIWQQRNRRWADAILLLLPLLLIGLSVRAYAAYRQQKLQVSVKRGASLPAFAAIDPQSLVLEPTEVQPGSFSATAEMDRRFPQYQIPGGQVLREDQLLPGKFSLQGRHILVLPIKTALDQSLLIPPARIRLMLTPRDKSVTPAIVEDVILLAVGKQGNSDVVTVALTEEGIRTIGPLLGLADTFMIESIR